MNVTETTCGDNKEEIMLLLEQHPDLLIHCTAQPRLLVFNIIGSSPF